MTLWLAVASIAIAASAQQPVAPANPKAADPQAADVAALNRAAAVTANGDTGRIAEDQAAYRRALADFHAAQRRNDAERAQAAAAAETYRADRAAYEASMIDWRRKVADVEQANAGRRRVAPPAPVPPAGTASGEIACRTVVEPPPTGSKMSRTRRVCAPAPIPAPIPATAR